jgi:hypothetical protein
MSITTVTIHLDYDQADDDHKVRLISSTGEGASNAKIREILQSALNCLAAASSSTSTT